MPSTLAARAFALVSLISAAAAIPDFHYKRQSNSTSAFVIGSGTPTATIKTTITEAPTMAGMPPAVMETALTCTEGIIPAGFAAEPADAAIFCSSFIGIPAVTITTNGITETKKTTHLLSSTRYATLTTTYPCTIQTSTVTTVYTMKHKRDVTPLTARAALPHAHPFMIKEREASMELASSDCSTLLSTFSHDCSCLFLTTSTATICGTTTVTLTENGVVYQGGTTTASTCSGTSIFTTTKTLQDYVEPSTTVRSTVPPTTIPTVSSFPSSTKSAVTSTPTSADSIPAVTGTPASVVPGPSSFPIPQNTTSMIMSPTPSESLSQGLTAPVPTNGTTPAPVSPTTSNAALSQNSTQPPFPTTSGGDRVGTQLVTIPGTTLQGTTVPGTVITDVYTIPANGTTVTEGGTTKTYPATNSTSTLFITETVTPIPVSTGVLPPVNTTGAPFGNATSPTAPLSSGPTAPLSTGPSAPLTTGPLTTGPSTGAVPSLNTTSAPYTFSNASAPATTPFTSGTGASSGLPIPTLSQPNGTRSGGVPSSSAPFPAGNTTAPFPIGSGTGIVPTSASTGFPIPPLSQPNGTRSGGVLTTSAPFPAGNTTAPFPTGSGTGLIPTGASTGFPIPSLSQPNGTRSGGFPSTSAPFPALNSTSILPTGTVGTVGTIPLITPSAGTSNPYFVPGFTTRRNGTYTTTFTRQVTTTQVTTFNTTITTDYISESVIVVTLAGETAATTTGTTVFPSGTAGTLYPVSVPSGYTGQTGPTLGSPPLTTVMETATATADAAATVDVGAGGGAGAVVAVPSVMRRWVRVRKDAPREEML